MSYNPLTPNQLTTEQRWKLIKQIFALLSANGEFPRGVYDAREKVFPKGPNNIMGKMMDRYPFDAVRCEIGGITLTVEITNKYQGAQDETDENKLRYATNDYSQFQCWFYTTLKRSGIEPRPVALTSQMNQPNKRPGTIKMDLRSKPYIPARKKKGGCR